MKAAMNQIKMVGPKTIVLRYGFRVLHILQEVRDGLHPGIRLGGPFIAIPLAGATACRGTYDSFLDVDEIKEVGLREVKFELVAPGIFRDCLTGEFADIGLRNE